MRMVMPTVVRHSAAEPFMPMARFETGPGGNPHWHLFAMGLAGPRMQRVRGDENGDGDEPPDTGSVDERCVVKALGALNAGAVVRVGLEAVAGLAHRQLTWFVRRVLCGLDGDIRVEAESDEDGSHGVEKYRLLADIHVLPPQVGDDDPTDAVQTSLAENTEISSVKVGRDNFPGWCASQS